MKMLVLYSRQRHISRSLQLFDTCQICLHRISQRVHSLCGELLARQNLFQFDFFSLAERCSLAARAPDLPTNTPHDPQIH